MKNKFLLFILFFLISFLTVYKSVYNYIQFHSANMPLFDGVMNEKKQILSYLRFHNNFSLIERINQVIYEFQGNPLSAGFGCLIAFFNPSWFINDWDIYIRAFISVFVFCVLLYLFLKLRNFKLIDIILILLLFFSLPFFYNYQIGLVTYTPEISSGLLLLSGYLSILIFLSNSKNSFFYLGFLLMLCSVIFRFNFFVYVIILVCPFLIQLYKKIKEKNKLEKIKLYSFFLLCLSFLILYVVSNLDFFIGYYLKPAEYSKFEILSSFQFFYVFLKTEFGLIGLMSLLLILCITNYQTNEAKIKLFQLTYPFLFSFFFFFIKMKATQPHIFVLVVVLALPLFVININFIKQFVYKISKNYYRLLAILLIFILNFNFYAISKESAITIPRYKASRQVSEYLIQLQMSKKTINYFCAYDEMLEVPISVYIYKKNHTFVEPNLFFYYHDWNFYDIDKGLDFNRITKFYLENIEKKIDLIVINKNLHSTIKLFKNAAIINRAILNYLSKSNKFYVDKIEKNGFFGDLIYFRRK